MLHLEAVTMEFEDDQLVTVMGWYQTKHPMQFLSTVHPCCNVFAGSVSRWKFITVNLNTQLLITVSNFSRIPAHVQLILGLQPMRVTSSSFSPLLIQPLIITLRPHRPETVELTRMRPISSRSRPRLAILYFITSPYLW
jgi:hypothetical protein